MIGEAWTDGEMGFLARNLDVWLHKNVTRGQRGLEEEVLMCPWRGGFRGGELQHVFMRHEVCTWMLTVSPGCAVYPNLRGRVAGGECGAGAVINSNSNSNSNGRPSDARRSVCMRRTASGMCTCAINDTGEIRSLERTINM